MPTTPDRPDGRTAGPGDEYDAAEASYPDARDTEEFDPAPPERRAIRSAAPDRRAIEQPGRRAIAPPARLAIESGPAGQEHETVLLEPGDRPTVAVDPADRATVTIDRETVKLPGQRRPPENQGGRAPLLVAAGFATLWAALLSYVPVTAVIGLARTLEGAGGIGGAAHAGLAGWLLGHDVPIGTSIGPLQLAPLLLTLLVVWRLNKAGLHVTRAIGARHSRSLTAALRVAGTIAVAYAVLGWLAAVLVDGPGTDVSPVRAFGNFLGLGLLGALIGALRSTEGLVVIARKIPPVLRHGVRTGLVAALLILAAGAAFAGLSVAFGGGQAANMIAAYRTGTAGQAGITLLSLAYGANGAVWAAAYLLGPGFLLGSDSAVRLTEVLVGPLPTLPLLAGLPDGPVGASGALLLAVPVLIGLASGWLLVRRLSRGRGHGAPKRPVQGGPARPGEPPHHSAQAPWSRVIGSALTAGPVAGLALGALSWLSGGGLGSSRMAEIGPVSWQVALVATAIVGVSGTIGAAAARAFRSTPPRP